MFASEKEAYDFCLRVYKDTGGVTPELRRAYEQYQSALYEEHPTGYRAAPPHVRPHLV